MPFKRDDTELQALTQSDDEKYTAKSPSSQRSIVVLIVCFVAGVLYLTTHAGKSSKPRVSVYNELHQTVHNHTKENDGRENPSKPETSPEASVGGKEAVPDRSKTPADKKKPATPSTGKAKAKDSAPLKPNDTPLKVEDMIKSLAVARTDMEAKLRVQYGSSFDDIFLDENGVNRGRLVFTSGESSSTVSWSRFRRKLMIKLLTAHVTSQPSVPVVWATGGHSSAAGHGNFFDESYTAYLERAAQPVFQSVGLNFTARNYAMGGTAAGAEIALCIKEIFGDDDLIALSWDFGMTDGNEIWKQSLYHRRASLLKSRPINIAYHADGRSFRYRAHLLREMEEMGLPALISSEAVLNAAMEGVPDTFGKSKEEIDAMPQYVRSFRCGKQIEAGDPSCGAEKYNMTIDCFVPGRVKWHPGYKWHALMGFMAGFFLIEVLEDALKEILAKSSETPTVLLKALQSEENAEYETFYKAATPDHWESVLPQTGDNGFDLDAYVNGENFCHTARLPAEIRHRGILTESTKTGFTTYDKGMALSEATSARLEGDTMQLVYTDKDRHQCSVAIDMDYKDYFYVSSADSWKSIVIPNDSELKEYPNKQPLKGFVTICFTLCPWGKCPAGVLDAKAFPDQIEIRVNGRAVTALRTFQDCVILEHEDGFRFPANEKGRFEIRVQVKDASQGSYLRLSSIVIG